MLHDAWQILFFNPFFWEQTGKSGLDLRRVCRNFRAELPEELAIKAAFGGVLIKKADTFRLFPLAVRDVVGLQSPLLFVDAFRVALRKSGSFEFCIAVVREKGLLLRNSVGVRREMQRAKLSADLLAGGVDWAVTGALFESAVAGRRQVDSAVVWRLDCLIQEQHQEEDAVLLCLRNAVGYWYKGINKHAQSVRDAIRHARLSRQLGCMHHQHIAGRRFVFGLVKFSVPHTG
jgi:hypothetical protein